MVSSSGNVNWSNAVPSRLPTRDAVHHKQVWPARPPFPPLNALRATLQMPPPGPAPATCLPPWPYSNFRPDARFSVPRAPNVVQLSTQRPVGGFQYTPQLSSVPRCDFRQPARLQQVRQQQPRQQQQQQQAQQQVHGVSSQNQLISLLVQHCRLTEHFLHQLELSLNAIVNELSQVTGGRNLPSPSVLKACNLLQMLNNEEEVIRWQYRVEYVRAYNVLVGHADHALVRINENLVVENLRVVLMCAVGIEAATLELRSCLVSLTNCTTRESVEATEAAILRHVGEFWRFFDSFKKALVDYTNRVFRCSLACSANQAATANCSQTAQGQTQSMSESETGRTSTLMPEAGRPHQQVDDDEEWRAFNDDVDQLLLEQQREQTAASSTCRVVTVSTSSVVDRPSSCTMPIDTLVTCGSRMPDAESWTANTNTGLQVDPCQASAQTADSELTEVKFQSRLQVQQTDLGYITIDDDDYNHAGLQPYPDHTSELIDPWAKKLADAVNDPLPLPDDVIGAQDAETYSPAFDWLKEAADAADAGDDSDLMRHIESFVSHPMDVKDLSGGLDSCKVQVAPAVDLMPLGSFDLFVPFLPDESRPQPEEPASRPVGYGSSNDGSDNTIVIKQEEPTDVEPFTPPDYVIGAHDEKAKDADTYSLSFDWLTDVDVADVGEESNLMCRIESVLSVPLDVFEATDIYSASFKQPAPAAFDEEQTNKRLPVPVERAPAEHHHSVPVPTSIFSTMHSSSKIADVNPRKRRVRRRRQSPKLTASKRKSSENRSDAGWKMARNVDNWKPMSGRSGKPPVLPASAQPPWICEKKLLIAPPPPPPPVMKKRRGRPPKRRIDTVAMPSPAELRCRPAARRKILALYRSSQFTPLDGTKRTTAQCHLPNLDEQSPQGQAGQQLYGQRPSSFSGTRSPKTTAAFNNCSVSRAATVERANPLLQELLGEKLDANKRSLSSGNDTEACLAVADYSTQQSVASSAAAAASGAPAQSNSSCNMFVSSLTGVNVSAVENPPPAQSAVRADSQHADENSSTLPRLAGETTTTRSRGFYMMDVENDDDDDDDEYRDRLVIDLDHADPSDYSTLSDECSHRGRTQSTSTATSGWFSSVRNSSENDSTPMNVSDIREAAGLTAATDKPPQLDSHVETTSGNHVNTSTSYGPLPARPSTFYKCKSGWMSTYCYGISQDKNNNNEYVTSTLGAGASTLQNGETVDRQRVVDWSSGSSAMDVTEPLVATPQTTTMTALTSSARHSESFDSNENFQYIEVNKSFKKLIFIL